MRREFPNHVKLAAWRRCGGHCEACGALVTGVAEYHHVLEDGLGGEPTLENCQVLCRACHRDETRRGVKLMARADRAARFHAGIRRKSRPINGSKASGWKHAMSGEWSRR